MADGNTLDNDDGIVARMKGLYAGDSDVTVAVPPTLVEENTTMLLFHAANVSNITVELGLPSSQHLRVLPVSHFGGSFTLSGQYSTINVLTPRILNLLESSDKRSFTRATVM